MRMWFGVVLFVALLMFSVGGCNGGAGESGYKCVRVNIDEGDTSASPTSCFVK